MNDDILAELRIVLCDRMLAQNLSQSQLAEASDISRTHVVQFFSGRRGMTLPGLQKLCEALGGELQVEFKQRAER